MNCPWKQRAQFHKQLNPNQPLLMAIYPVDFSSIASNPHKISGIEKKNMFRDYLQHR